MRATLHDLTRVGSADDFEGDLEFEDRPAVRDMVWERRAADKVAPFERWAGRTIATHADLDAADYDDRYAHFARIVPDNTIGRHALQHVAWVIGTPPAWQFRRFANRSATGDPPDELRLSVEAILAAGAHGDLNRRIKDKIPAVVTRNVFVSGRWTFRQQERPRRVSTVVSSPGNMTWGDFVADVRGSEEGSIAVSFARHLDR